MTSTIALRSAPAAVHRRTRRLSPTASLYLLASIAVGLLAASSTPTPLYAVYQAEWHFTPVTTTIVFGIYALAVLASLLTLGRLSDHIGRRPILLGALAGQIASLVVFTTASGVPELLIARVVQGLATGAALGAVGAALIDVDRVKGPIANAVAPMTGVGSGALLSGVLVQFAPAPTHTIYLVMIAVFAVQAVGVTFMRETVSPKPGALASLRPEIALPRAARRPVLVAAPVLVAMWALAGFYGSLGPSLVRQVTGSNSIALGGLALGVIAGSAAIAVFVLRNLSADRLMRFGVVAMIAGVAVTLVAINAHSGGWFFIGSAIAGLGFGGGFQGGIRSVVPFARAHERAGVLSVLYVVCYLALGIPAVIAGFLVVDAGGLLTTAREYGVAIIVLAGLAGAGLIARPRRRAETPVLEAAN